MVFVITSCKGSVGCNGLQSLCGQYLNTGDDILRYCDRLFEHIVGAALDTEGIFHRRLATSFGVHHRG